MPAIAVVLGVAGYDFYQAFTLKVRDIKYQIIFMRMLIGIIYRMRWLTALLIWEEQLMVLPTGSYALDLCYVQDAGVFKYIIRIKHDQFISTLSPRA